MGLLAELARRGNTPGSSRWLRLFRETHGADLVTVCAAAGRVPSAPVSAELARILHGQDAIAARAAALALGAADHEEAVSALADALADGDPALRNAAIRGLGRTGSAPARSVLEQAANAHVDPATRRRASAELVARFETRGAQR